MLYSIKNEVKLNKSQIIEAANKNVLGTLRDLISVIVHKIHKINNTKYEHNDKYNGIFTFLQEQIRPINSKLNLKLF